MVSSSIVEFVKQRDDACAALEIRVARKIPNLPFYMENPSGSTRLAIFPYIFVNKVHRFTLKNSKYTRTCLKELAESWKPWRVHQTCSRPFWKRFLSTSTSLLLFTTPF